MKKIVDKVLFILFIPFIIYLITIFLPTLIIFKNDIKEIYYGK